MTKSPSSEASHDSGDENNDATQSSKTSTVKDKACQYCQQKFTSSSLGRHLDQFIFKKKPDGIHDVDEIRRMRGGITRRTARNASGKKEQDDAQSTQHSPSPQYTLPSYSELVTKTTSAPGELRFNRMNWQATGVITDPPNLNPPAATVVSPSISHAPQAAASGTKRNFSTYAADLPTLNAGPSETTRALELSLREVLDAVRTATKRAAPAQQPFSFDLTSQTFPYLCLALLPPPPTLFTPTPFASSNSISLSPPGAEQHEHLRKNVEYQIDQWKWSTLSHIQKTSSSPNFSENVENVNDAASNHKDIALKHLDAAFRNFMSFSPESRQSLWTIELLRAFKTEQDKVKEANARNERLVQETYQLQQQIDHLSKCQWPREMALWPPDRVTLDEKTKSELGYMNLLKGETNGAVDTGGEGSTDEQQRGGIDRWDYDLLVNKWKKHVRDDRGRRAGIQPSLPFLSGTTPAPFPENQTSAPSEHSTASTPRIPSNLTKSTMAEYRSGSMSHNLDTTSLHNSPLVNGASRSGASSGFESRPRNFAVVSDVDDIFTPRFRGLRAEAAVKSATP